MRKCLLYLALYDPRIPLTGASRRAYQFIDLLSTNMDLDLVHMEGCGQAPLPGLLPPAPLANVREVRRVPFGAWGYFFFSPEVYRAAEDFLRRQRYDFILCDYGLSALYGLILSRKFGVPLVYSSHNIEYKGNLDKANKDLRRLPLALYMYLVERAGVRRARFLVSITDDEAAFYERWKSREDMVVIPQGIDEEVFHPFYPAAKNDPQRVLFCGNLKSQFNRDAVRTVMDTILDPVLKRRPCTKFIFVGAHPPTDVHHPQVEFTGFLEDCVPQLRRADVVISPMGQGRGFPTKIVEALACGKPTIATPIGARALERDYKRLEVCSLEEFPDRICRALERNQPVSPEDFEKIRVRYSWKKNIMRLVERMEEKPAIADSILLCPGQNRIGA